MEKKLYELKIDEEFRTMIPELSESEEAMLKASILDEGCTSPIVVWNGVIIDGHHRYAICQEYGVPFAIEEKEFESRDEAIEWIIFNQMGRRNLSQYSKCELALRFEPMLQKEAKKRQGRRTDLKGDAIGYRPIDTRTALANMAGVSANTMGKAKKIFHDADEETKRRLRPGDISIHFAYSALAQNGSKCGLHSQGENLKNSRGIDEIFIEKTPGVSCQPSIDFEGIERIKKELGVLANEILVGDMDRILMMRSIEAIGMVVRAV